MSCTSISLVGARPVSPAASGGPAFGPDNLGEVLVRPEKESPDGCVRFGGMQERAVPRIDSPEKRFEHHRGGGRCVRAAALLEGTSKANVTVLVAQVEWCRATLSGCHIAESV